METEDLLLDILKELKEISAKVSVLEAKTSWYKWGMGFIVTAIIGLTSVVINIALRV
jgi:hypothetical protein